MKSLAKKKLLGLSSTVQKVAISRLVNMPKPLVRKLAGKQIVIEGQSLDRALQLVLRLLAIPAKKTTIEDRRAEIDEQGAWLAQPQHPDVIIDEFWIGVDDGTDSQIRLRRYRHREAKDQQPALVYYHGGGYVLGSITSHDTPCQHLAIDGKCTVISVDYRLAPEHPFPVPVNDGIRFSLYSDSCG